MTWLVIVGQYTFLPRTLAGHRTEVSKEQAFMRVIS
jgi:hypothetical protein